MVWVDRGCAARADNDNIGSKVTTWRMPLETEDQTGIWHRRYYLDGTFMARVADGEISLPT